MARAIPRPTPDVLARPRAATRSRLRLRRRAGQGAILTALLVLLALTMVPIILMIVLSLKDNGQIYGRFWGLPDPVLWENYAEGWRATQRYIVNSLVYSLASVAGVVFLSSLSGYVFARHNFPGKELIYLGVLALLMVPGVLTLI